MKLTNRPLVGQSASNCLGLRLLISSIKKRKSATKMLLVFFVAIQFSILDNRQPGVLALDLDDNLVEVNNEADNLVNSWYPQARFSEEQEGEAPETRLDNNNNNDNNNRISADQNELRFRYNTNSDDQGDDFVSQEEEQFIINGMSSMQDGQTDDRVDLSVDQSPRRNEIYLLEDKDYPKSLFEDYSRRVGQVSGISALPSNDLIIFHRSERQWNGTTNEQMLKMRMDIVAADSAANKTGAGDDNRQTYGNSNLIGNDTLMIIDRDDGSSLASFGSNMFFMPHSCSSDRFGNIWLSDVGRHQVMRLPSSSLFPTSDHELDKSSRRLNGELRKLWPDIVLGEAFVSGSDEHHFCQPSEIATSSDGQLVFVADGYCNQRVMVFTSQGKFLKSFGEAQQMSVVHSLSLIEERNLVCVADRENARILCYSAGLETRVSPFASQADRLHAMGRLEVQVNYPIGRVYAIQAISADHLLVSSQQFTSQRYDLAILNPFTQELKLVWTSSDLLEPHALARTFDRQFAYAADVSHDAFKKVFKFEIIQRTA